MKMQGNIQFAEAIIVDEKLLKKLEETILEFFNEVTYECRLCNNDYIQFDSLTELLNYRNNKSRKIEMLKIKFDYSEMVFGQTNSMFCSYKYTVSGLHTVYDFDTAILFSEKVMGILEDGRRSKWYTMLTKISLFHFWIFLIVVSVGAAVPSMIKEGINGGSVYTSNVLNIGILTGLLLVVISNILGKWRNAVFPPISFMIGEQINEIKKNDDRLSKIFWGIIITFIISFIVAQIT